MTAGVLLAAHCTHGGERAPNGGEQRHEPTHAPAGIATDGKQVMRDAIEEADRAVAAERVRERQAVGARGVGVPVPDHLRRRRGREESSERERARASLGERTPRQRR